MHMDDDQIELRPVKKNGFCCPLNPLQVTSWLIYAYKILTFYLVIYPALYNHT
jgi:hypothetical protein